ncbi:MAG: MBOAT family protein [Akkermansiaceae bacterium]|jgi:D-alanyl-lipoteichoic acid acyltransferase DltB (MBOAT superfamily)|nr:MBOAT family protein [Akkermansiaceae bacterium]
MLFNSYTFLLLFLPVVLAGFLVLRRLPGRAWVWWLAVASLFYYGSWNPDPREPWSPLWLFLILASCAVNFLLGRGISGKGAGSRPMLVIGVVVNLAVLAWFKYAGLFDKTWLALTGGDAGLPDVILPLGISFFTFQQIAYLVDASRGETAEYRFGDYLLFVTFFPQLIAGPIVHHKEVMPQFNSGRGIGWARHFPVGFAILLVGLFKKIAVADPCAQIANPLFELAASGDRPLTMVEAWTAAVAYAMQIYFDFSGYSDMAIGAARMFGIRLPVNFASPYKAASIADFWRRWHITLSRFLRDYLYIPLGGNRHGVVRRYGNLLLTMVLGGLWHGAGWTFLLWGFLHGICLCVNHGWSHLRARMSWRALPKGLGQTLTFLAVLVAWVPFRAGNFELRAEGSTGDALAATKAILGSMFGAEGLSGLPDKASRVIASRDPLLVIIPLLACFLLPSTQEIFRRYRPCHERLPRAGRRWWHWRPSPFFTVATLVLLLVVGLNFDKVSEFIYFQF